MVLIYVIGLVYCVMSKLTLPIAIHDYPTHDFKLTHIFVSHFSCFSSKSYFASYYGLLTSIT